MGILNASRCRHPLCRSLMRESVHTSDLRCECQHITWWPRGRYCPLIMTNSSSFLFSDTRFACLSCTAVSWISRIGAIAIGARILKAAGVPYRNPYCLQAHLSDSNVGGTL